MKSINNDNIDEIMFQILEGEIIGDEKTRLLEAIAADPIYSKLWATWQNTIISPDDEIVYSNEQLKKRAVPIFHINFRYAAAAAIVFAIGLGAAYKLVFNDKDAIQISGIVPPKPNKPVIQTPLQPDKVTTNPLINPSFSDTVVSYKEKAKFMVIKNQKRNNPIELPI
ncbi:MAG: hypothetical protein IT245_03900, partial [Bacteroidia bacterium]|nr:hypothetical protein [Bacteroidia bacterium]